MTRSAKSSRKQTKGSLTLFLLLFSLPFLGVGIGMSTVVALNLLKVHRMRNWAETEARIAATELKVSHGDDSTSYRVTATYQYSYEGRRYTGDRVSIHTGSDSIGKFHHRMHQRLQQAMNSGEPVPCYVSPDDPAQAVLVRTLRIEIVAFQAVFGLVFGGAGLAVLVGGLNSRRSGRHSAALKTQHPDQPWLWRTSWAKGEIRSSGRTGAIALCLFAGVWWLISAPLTWHVIQHELPAGNRTALWVLLFPAVGLLILWGALYGLLRFVKYGVSVLQLSPMPGVIGGPLSGVVRVTRQIRPENGFQLKLTCINKVTTRSGKNTSTTEHVLWQDQHRIERELLAHDPTQTAIPVQFGIPFSERECDESNSNSTIEWRLEVTAKTPGIDYAAKFTVPVFKTDQSSPDYQPEAGLMAQYRANETPEEMLAAAGLRLTRLPTGTRVVCPPANRIKLALGTSLFAAIWTGAVIFMIKAGAPILFPIVFGLFDLLPVCMALGLWFRGASLDVDHGQVVARATFLGIPFRTIRQSMAELSELSIKQTMQSGSTVYFNIRFKAQGKSITIARYVAPRTAAERVQQALQQIVRGAHG